MAEYSRIARGHFTSTGLAQIVTLPFIPDYVEMTNYTVANSAATSQFIARAFWDSTTNIGTAIPTIVEGYNATPALIFDTVSTNGISTFSAGLSFQFGPVYQHTGSTDFSISKANPAVVTTTTAHGLASGDVVIFSNLAETATTGMQQITGIPFTVTVLSSTTFSIPWNTNQTNYTIFDSSTSTGNVGSFKKVLYPYLYAPGASIITNITTGATTTIDTTDAHNFVVGQEVAIRVPVLWGTTQLNSLPNATIPGSPIYGYVIAVTDYNTVVVNINSTGYTAFNSNPTVAQTVGLSYAQIVAVGDVNTGGVQISAGSALYPPPFTRPIGTTTVNTINGPAIQGAYFNNTSQGFIIGGGAGRVLTTASLVGAASDVIMWRAYLSDYSAN